MNLTPGLTRRACVLVCASLCVLLAAPTTLAATDVKDVGDAKPRLSFTQWSERFSQDWVRSSPESSTFMRYFAADEQAQLDGQLSPVTDAQRERRLALAAQGLARVDAYLAAGLVGDERIGALTMQWGLSRVIAAAPFEDQQFIYNQNFGAQVRYQSLFAEGQPLRRAADVAPYLSRLRAMPQRVAQELALAQRAVQRGFLPPRFIVERAQMQMRVLLDSALADEPVVAAFTRRISSVPDLDLAAREQAINAVQTTVGTQLRPSWERVAAFLQDIHPRTGNDAGLWRFSGGGAAYAQALASNTTTRMSADEIHQLGLREVVRLEGEMDRLLKAMGRTQGGVAQRMSALQKENQPPQYPDPRPALLKRYGALVADATQRAQSLFSLQPKVGVEVRRVGPLTERTASASYSPPASDGSRAAVFWVPMPGPEFNVLGMRTLTAHEAVPGHHFQLAIQQENQSLPQWRQRRVFGGGSAHSEGWALYAERLAIEQGWYEGDALGHLGALDAQLFRARRLVVDTGLHAKRWTREQAIAYGIGAQEVERYVVNPGQACAYMVGMLHIVALRDEARAVQGERFSLRDFHDLVLRTGSIPLDVLGEVVREWTAGRMALAKSTV